MSVAQSCLILCDPMNYNPPGSSVHGVSPGQNTGVGCRAFLQGKSSQSRDPTCIAYISCIGRQVLYPLSHLGSHDANAEGVVCELRSHRTHALPLPLTKKKKKKDLGWNHIL